MQKKKVIRKQYHKNPRKISEKQFAELRDSLQQLGDLAGIVYNTTSGEIVSGNQRSKVIDINECEVEYTEQLAKPDEQGTVAHGFVIWRGGRYAYREVAWDEKTEERAVIVANKLGGEWDTEILNSQFNKDSLLDWGFVESDFALLDMKTNIENEENEQEEEVKVLAAQEDDYEVLDELKTDIVQGDLITFHKNGEELHRLLCGDSTDSDQVEKLMNGEKADMVFTDPPYGVSYSDKNEFLNSFDEGNRNQKRIKNDSLGVSDMYDLWLAVFNIAGVYTKDVMSYYVASPQGGELMMMMKAINESPLALKHTIIWNKNNHVLGRSDYNYKHEPILYGWKKKGTHKFYGKGTCKTSVWDISKPHKSDLHPTMKPVKLVEECTLNSSKNGDVVLDLFGGSGTTMVASHQLNRKARLVELEKHYCQVIINRMLKLDSDLVVKINGEDYQPK
jgi:DNA modification methylase